MQINSAAAIILSGGLSRRFGGEEKGLELIAGKPMISHILERLAPQISPIFLNINRQLERYRAAYPQLPYYSDELPNFQGPLSGILSGFQQIDREYLLFVPCDSPFLPLNLFQKLMTSLQINQAQIAYAHDGERAHPTFALLHRSIMQPLQNYLARGERRLLHFFQTQKCVAVDFSEQIQAFQNFNTADALASGQICSTFCNIPLLAIAGYSGTGKTTLLEKLIPYLRQKGIKVGLIKHSHHNVEVDKPGKDSYRLRLAGANPTLIACDQRWAMMVETDQAVDFPYLLTQFQSKNIDLVLVEGFKHERLPKIQLHRTNLVKPLPELDDFTIATATDYPLARDNALDINNIEQIAAFIVRYFQLKCTEDLNV